MNLTIQFLWVEFKVMVFPPLMKNMEILKEMDSVEIVSHLLSGTGYWII